MKNYKKLNLKKLSIAKLDTHVLQKTIKGGTVANSNEAVNCQTSAATRPELTSDPRDPRYTHAIGPCV